MKEKQKNPKNPVKRLVRLIATIAFSLVAGAIFYLAVVVGQPTADAVMQLNPEAAVHAPLAASLPEKITDENAIPSLLTSYPAPIMRLSLGTDIVFSEGQTYDVAYEGAFARICDLFYQTADGRDIALKSIYPKSAYDLVDTRAYSLSPVLGYSLLHLNAVRMDAAQTIRFHVEGDEALYFVSIPKEYLDSAPSLLKLCQLEIPLS
jgi:hypothetical protein